MNRAAYILSAILALALAADASAVLPHPFHLSLAEVDCNRVTGELEVALAVLAIDFEETLSRRAGKRVNLDRTRGITTIIEDYLAERFTITLQDGSTPRPSFVGREDKGKVVWLYFTMPLGPQKPIQPLPRKHTATCSPKEPIRLSFSTSFPPIDSPLIGTRLHNRILTELNAEQYNRVIVRDGTWRRNLIFKKHTRTQVLRQRTSETKRAQRQVNSERPRTDRRRSQ